VYKLHRRCTVLSLNDITFQKTITFILTPLRPSDLIHHSSLSWHKNLVFEAFEQVKQEAVHLHHKLKEAEDRKTSLLEEERTRSTPAQEREQLLQRVKDDNAEMATMERQIGEIQELIHKKRQELEQIEQVQLEWLHATLS
jgi:septal ring factor EnvC (AmiA/AmiB activator)